MAERVEHWCNRRYGRSRQGRLDELRSRADSGDKYAARRLAILSEHDALSQLPEDNEGGDLPQPG
jgi:hypothetical protein